MNFFKCEFCTYFSDRKYNLQKHINNKHITETKNSKIVKTGQNVTPGGQNVTYQLFCKKCNKVYKTKKRRDFHELKCKGVDELTCPKCMLSFSNRHHKSRHIKANNCKARSIIHAREPNPQNIINTQNNFNNNIQNNIHNQNIIINSFGNERIDHITKGEIIKMLRAGIHTIPKYIERKHFDKDFPENNNILYTKENKCKVLEDNNWQEKDISTLSSKLIKENANVLLLYCENDEIKLSEEIKDEDVLKSIKNKLVVIYDNTDNKKYNYVLNSIKDLIKNARDEIDIE